MPSSAKSPPRTTFTIRESERAKTWRHLSAFASCLRGDSFLRQLAGDRPILVRLQSTTGVSALFAAPQALASSCGRGGALFLTSFESRIMSAYEILTHCWLMLRRVRGKQGDEKRTSLSASFVYRSLSSRNICKTPEALEQLTMAFLHSALLFEGKTKRKAGLMQPAPVKQATARFFSKGKGGSVFFRTQIHTRIRQIQWITALF